MHFDAYALPDILHGKLIISVDGEDVTDRCFEADTDRGWCGLYKHRNGKEYIDDQGEIAKEDRNGTVTISLKPGVDLLADILGGAEKGAF